MMLKILIDLMSMLMGDSDSILCDKSWSVTCDGPVMGTLHSSSNKADCNILECGMKHPKPQPYAQQKVFE